MKMKMPFLTLPFAVASFVFIGPRAGYAQNSTANDALMTNADTARNAADQMVPAEAALKTTVDARKDRPGSGFDAVLTQRVHLKDGTTLPKGTTLVGNVEADAAQSQGESTLALRFTEAKLKDGKQVPIKATIVQVAPPQAALAGDETASQTISPWDGKSLQMDQVGAVPGVDLHSRIASNESGTFVSTKKDVKLVNGSQLALAIGLAGNA